MKSVKFPKTVEKIKMIWRESHGGYVALVEKEGFIKLYIWDGISVSWNESLIFERVKMKKVKEGGE